MKEPTKEVIDYDHITNRVNEWLISNTFQCHDFKDIGQLVDSKKNQKITLAIPTLNEQKTIGKIIKKLKPLSDKYNLLDEIIVVDSGSTDNTRQEAVQAGAKFYLSENHLKEQGIHRGKGENLWTSLYVSQGDIIAWIDADIKNIHPRFVYGILGPLLMNENISYSKSFYERPLDISLEDGKKINARTGGGRVTEIGVKPDINWLFPNLVGFIQPLSGEYAGKRELLEQIPFFSGYAVEIGHLIDIDDRFGLETMAQVDLIKREHRNQDLDKLGKMAYGIKKAMIMKAEEQGKIVNKIGSNGLRRPTDNLGTYTIFEESIENVLRPPMIKLPEYRRKFKR